MAGDGIYYCESRQPFVVAAQTAITLAATDKLLYPGSLTALPANYFNVGKVLRITIFGSITTGATPGNLGIELYYGTTDAGGTLLASSAAQTLLANQTTQVFWGMFYCRCRATGPTGSLLAWGSIINIQPAVVAVATFTVPANAPAAVTVDTTAASGFNVQAKRSGSTAETMQVQDLIYEVLN
jgi:hypothetical protein